MPGVSACGRTLRLEGFPPSFERLACSLLDPARDDLPPHFVTCEGPWEPPDGASYWPVVRPAPEPDGPWVAESRTWRCRFDPSRGIFRVRLRPLRTDATRQRVSHLLRLPVVVDVTMRGGRFLHAAALVRDGAAGLFVGPSRVGKTTLARKVPTAARLADDAAIVLPDGERFVAWRSPFPGRESLPATGRAAPVAAVFVLEQALRQSVTRLAPAEAFRALLPHVTPVRAPWVDGNTLEPLAALVERVPAFRLRHTLETDPMAVLGDLAS